MNKEITIYAVGEDELDFAGDDIPEYVSRVCHNYGVWFNREGAQMRVDALNEDDEENPTHDDNVAPGERYYVKELAAKDTQPLLAFLGELRQVLNDYFDNVDSADGAKDILWAAELANPELRKSLQRLKALKELPV